MSVRLRVGDAILVSIKSGDNNSSKNKHIGVIRYIGYIDGYCMSEYVGLELVESINNGHNGTINGYQYFHCSKGYGIHTKITNIIGKLAASEVTIKMQEMMNLFKSRLKQYIQAVSDRDAYIEKLKTKQRDLRNLLKESEALQQHVAMQMNYSADSSKTPSKTPSMPFNATSESIILFNPQKQNVRFPQLKVKSARTSKTSQFQPITPMTLSPRSGKRNNGKDKFPDTVPTLSYDSTYSSKNEPKSSELYIRSEYAVYMEYKSDSEPSDDEEHELCDEYDDNDTALNLNGKTINGTYTNNVRQQQQIEQMVKSKSHSPQNKRSNTRFYPGYKSMSQSPQQPQQQQRQFVYTHFSPQNMNNIAPMMVPMPLSYLPQQTAPNHGYIALPFPSFKASMSNPICMASDDNKMQTNFGKAIPALYHNSYSDRAPTTIHSITKQKRNVLSNRQQMQPQHTMRNHQQQQQHRYPVQYVVSNSNAVTPYYVQPQVEHWMEQQRQKHKQQN